MKTKLFIISALALSMTANAQITVSGSFGINSVSENTRILDNSSYNGSELDQLSNSFEFSPSVGYITGDYEFGASLGLGSVKTTSRNVLGNLNDNKTKTFSFGLYGRRYFNIAGSLNFLVNLSADYGFGKTENESWNGACVKSNAVEVSITPGFTYDFNEHWGIEADLDFIGLSWLNEYESAYDSDGKLAGDGSYTSTFGFSGTTAPGSINDMFSGVSIGIYYVF